MGRKIGSKNKNTNTAKNKNVININVNSSTSKRGKGRPRKQKQSNDTTQYRQAGGMMAPPQVIISQPTPQQDNSLLSSFITSRMLNESNMLNSRTSMPSVVEPPTGRGDLPSYFSARESIIPRLPETPIPKPIIKPADITPSTIIKTKEPLPEPEPPKIDIKPDEVAPPKTTGRPNFYRKLKNTASTVADAASSELGTSIIESAINEIDKTHIASTLIGSALRGHRGRQTHALKKQYPELVNKRLEDVKRMEPLNALTYQPVAKDEKPQYLNMLEKKKEKDKKQLEKELSKNTISQDLINVQTPIQKIAAKTLQNALRQKFARNKVADKYIEKQQSAAAKIQGLTRGVKTRNILANDKDFQNKIDMKIKKYGDAASEYKTRGADTKDINKEFSNVIKTMRTGLQNYKTTLGTQAKKRGPKPKPKYLNVNELEV